MNSIKDLILRIKNSCEEIGNQKAIFIIMLFALTIISFAPVDPASSDSTGDIPVCWDFIFSLGGNGSIEFNVNAVAKLEHDPVYNIAPGDLVTVTSEITRDPIDINLILYNLGTFSDLEGNYTIPLLDSIVGILSIPVPEASAIIPLIGNVTVFLEIRLGIKYQNANSGATMGGASATYDGFLPMELKEEHGFVFPESTKDGDLTISETTFWLMVSKLGINIKEDNTSILTLNASNIQGSWPGSATLSLDIEVGLSKPISAFEAFILIPVFTILVLIRKRKGKKT